ncbi:MAG TPA: helix-turn-helix domain-containing protein [Gemmatimonadales bacterium]|nr:helix-turn-helix domain-containing protein [Gemmatimonadales bacterium]
MTTNNAGVTPTPAQPFPSQIGRAVMDALGEGLVVFDAAGKALYLNTRARQALGVNQNATAPRAEQLRPRLSALGARTVPLKAGPAELGEAVFVPTSDGPRTLAEQEREAIVDTLRATSGKLAETARRLGISRTTLWRRLKAYGLDREHRGNGRRQ